MVFSSTSQSKSSKEILLFLQCEHHCWFEIVELLNRMPLTDRIITDNCSGLDEGLISSSSLVRSGTPRLLADAREV